MIRRRDVLFCVLLVVLLGTFWYQLSSLQAQVALKETQLDILRNEQKALGKSFEIREAEWVDKYQEVYDEFLILNTSHSQLQGEYESLSEEKGKVDEELGDLTEVYQEEFTKLMDGLTDFEEKVQSSMDWFQESKNIEDIKDYWQLKLDLFADCVHYNENFCDIKLYCIPFINKNEYGVEYRTDESSVDKVDYLLSLEQIWDNGGGDCEDISALFTSEYEYLYGRCEELGYEDDKIRAISVEYEKDSRVVVSNEADYYYPDTTTVTVSEGGGYVYPVCGLFPGQTVGHCVVAVTQEQITSNADIPRILEGAPLVEPQVGNFLGYIGDDGPLRVYESGEEIEWSNYVSLVMTGNDIAYFNVRTGQNEWKGYEEFLSEVEEKKEELRTLYKK